MSYRDELFKLYKADDAVRFSPIELRGMRDTACAEVDSLRGRLAVADAALAEAREENEVLSLAASELVKIAKIMTQDDGVDPEAWWIELSGEDANLVKLVAENVKRLEDDPTVEDGPNTAARRANFPQNYCKHGTLKGHCPMCE